MAISSPAGTYTVFRIPKKSGGWRTIEAPDPDLKLRQAADLRNLERTLLVSPFAHAFTHGRNIKTMAAHHVGCAAMVRCDIKDFFPSVRLSLLTQEVRKQFDYLERTAESPETSAESAVLFIRDLHMVQESVAAGDSGGLWHRLPQGAPASPFLSNVALWSFDWTLAHMAARRAVRYSRYADDIVLSVRRPEDRPALLGLFKVALGGLRHRGLEPNWRKVHETVEPSRMFVCGLATGRKLATRKRWRRNLRAAEHQEGLWQAGLRTGPCKDHGLVLAGKRGFARMVAEYPAGPDPVQFITALRMTKKL